jgi:hypothetical protein
MGWWILLRSLSPGRDTTAVIEEGLEMESVIRQNFTAYCI